MDMSVKIITLPLYYERGSNWMESSQLFFGRFVFGCLLKEKSGADP